MKLIVILACLALERYANASQSLQRVAVWDLYFSSMQGLAKKINLPTPWLQLALYVLPLWVLIAVLLALFSHGLFGLIGLVLHIALLCYCIGPGDLHQQVEACVGEDKGASDAATKALLGGDVPEDDAKRTRAITDAIFVEANDRYYATLFWYVMPFGVLLLLLYRMSSLLAHKAKVDATYKGLASVAETVNSVLNWIPARISSLAYVLVGNFSQAFTYWFSKLLKGLHVSAELLANTGSLALGVNKTKPAATENSEAIAMVDRALIVVLVIIAVFTLGAWIS